jgi:hypothetical protein
VVGGLILVGGLLTFLTVLYWRRTRPPKLSTALDALADLETSPAAAANLAAMHVGTGLAAPTTVGGAVPGVAPTIAAPVVGPVGSSAVGGAVGGAMVAGAAGSGVRIIGPVTGARQAGGPDTPTELVEPDIGAASPAGATVEPEPLVIVTLEELQERAKAAPPSSAQIDAEAPSVTDPGYGGEHG